MLMILTLGIPAQADRPWSRRHEPRAAAGCRPRDPAPRVCGDGRLRARHRPVGRAEGDAAAPDARLDLGDPDGRGGYLFVLDPSDQIVWPLEPDPFSVHL